MTLGRPFKVAGARMAALYADYLRGVPLNELARQYDCDDKSISRYARRFGWPKRGQIYGERLAAILADYRAGLSVAEIARRHGIAGSTVTSHARKAGISRRKSYERRHPHPLALTPPTIGPGALFECPGCGFRAASPSGHPSCHRQPRAA